jgi:hypothetical protein
MKSFLDKTQPNLPCNQLFWAWSRADQPAQDGFDYYANSGQLVALMQSMATNTRFVFHGFFDPSLWPKLLFSALPKRCVWVCWGHDIYQHRAPGRSLKQKAMHLIHVLLARRFIKSFALNQGDANIITQQLVTSNVAVLPYPLIGSNAVRAQSASPDKTIILLGNSASPNNEHIQALDWLKGFKDEAIEIVLPLNYAGPKEYVEQVIAYGQKVFADKFSPITQMLAKADYDQLLANVDIAVFAHKRQQGLYVVYSALKQGQKMYLRSDTSSFTALQGAGFDLCASEEISNMSFADFIDSQDLDMQKNKVLLSKTYSEEALLPQWQAMLEQLFSPA